MSDESLPRPEVLLPHRAPFLFVDELTAIVPGESAAGIWRLTGDEFFFAGHFPGRPTLPGVLMCEAIAQVGAIAVLTDQRFAGKLPLFGGLDGARFRRQAVPGDTLELNVERGRMSARAGQGTGTATVNGDTACSCERPIPRAPRMRERATAEAPGKRRSRTGGAIGPGVRKCASATTHCDGFQGIR
jgi:3-hydroxyacyl-[acyl-carrier-protein] dehydratase